MPPLPTVDDGHDSRTSSGSRNQLTFCTPQTLSFACSTLLFPVSQTSSLHLERRPHQGGVSRTRGALARSRDRAKSAYPRADLLGRRDVGRAWQAMEDGRVYSLRYTTLRDARSLVSRHPAVHSPAPRPPGDSLVQLPSHPKRHPGGEGHPRGISGPSHKRKKEGNKMVSVARRPPES